LQIRLLTFSQRQANPVYQTRKNRSKNCKSTRLINRSLLRLLTILVGSFMWYIQLWHSPDGPLLTGHLLWAPYGSTQSGFMALQHDCAWDSVEMSLTVAGEPGTVGGQTGLVWGDFSGSFKAVHRRVPDGGTTLALLSFGLGILGWVRRAVMKA
jgi:hypothetical protein